MVALCNLRTSTRLSTDIYRTVHQPLVLEGQHGCPQTSPNTRTVPNSPDAARTQRLAPEADEETESAGPKSTPSSSKQAGTQVVKKRKHSPKTRKPLPENWPSTLPSRSYIAASHVHDMEGKPPPGTESSHFPGQPLTKHSGGTLSPEQWRHIRMTYAFARYSLEEDEYGGIPEVFRIPLGYIRQLLWHYSGDFDDGINAMPSHAEMKGARINKDVLPTFPGMPLEDNYSRSLSPAQLEHVEDTYCRLVAGMDKIEDFRYGKRDYSYLLAILEQLIHNYRGERDEACQEACEAKRRAVRRRRVR